MLAKHFTSDQFGQGAEHFISLRCRVPVLAADAGGETAAEGGIGEPGEDETLGPAQPVGRLVPHPHPRRPGPVAAAETWAAAAVRKQPRGDAAPARCVCVGVCVCVCVCVMGGI